MVSKCKQSWMSKDCHLPFPHKKNGRSYGNALPPRIGTWRGKHIGSAEILRLDCSGLLSPSFWKSGLRSLSTPALEKRKTTGGFLIVESATSPMIQSLSNHRGTVFKSTGSTWLQKWQLMADAPQNRPRSRTGPHLKVCQPDKNVGVPKPPKKTGWLNQKCLNSTSSKLVFCSWKFIFQGLWSEWNPPKSASSSSPSIMETRTRSARTWRSFTVRNGLLKVSLKGSTAWSGLPLGCSSRFSPSVPWASTWG